MTFLETPLAGAFVVEMEPVGDERGFFARTWCASEWQRQGLNPALVQCNITWNRHRGTVRGMHYQRAPHQEAKLVRCTRGAVFDVIIDLRRESVSYCRWFAAELTAANRRMMYVPEGFAHGLQTLEDDTEVFYQMSREYHPESAAGVRWNDPAFGIQWPGSDHRLLSARDAGFADYQC